MGEVLTAQGMVQQVMAEQQSEFRTQHGEFQASMAKVLRSHNNQLAAHVATQQSLVTQMGVSTSHWSGTDQPDGDPVPDERAVMGYEGTARCYANSRTRKERPGTFEIEDI